MAASRTIPTVEDFERYDWLEVIADCKVKECSHYCSSFCGKVVEAEASGDEVAQQVFAILGSITLAALKSESRKEPFDSDWVQGFTSEQLSLFRTIAPSVADAELRARFADVVWVRQRDPQMARLAVEAYLESARTLESPEEWDLCADRIVRATHLAYALGKVSEPFNYTLTHIKVLLDKYDGDDPLFLSAVLMELLQEYKQGDCSKYADLAEKAAKRAIAEKEWEKARRYLRIQAEWHFMADELDKGREARLLVAETNVLEAEDIISRPGQFAPYAHASHKIERAIKAYSDIDGSGARERRDELYKLLREYQPKANKEFISLSPPISGDVQVIEALFTEFAVNSVKGKNLTEAIVSLASFPLAQGVTQLRQQIEPRIRKSPVWTLLPLTMHSSQGLKVAAPPAQRTTREEQIEAEIDAQMFSLSNNSRTWRAGVWIWPAIHQINEEHNIHTRDLIPIVLDSPFVPANREFIYVKGLHAGLTGDYLTAVHLLIPQIENSIRHVLALHGMITSGFGRRDVQNHYDLNRVLNNKEQEAKLIEILGDDLVFEIKGLLVQHYGANLRNEIAHGTLDVHDFNSDFYRLQCFYLLWLTLRLCLTNVLPTEESS
jgi:hypothetical protein